MYRTHPLFASCLLLALSATPSLAEPVVVTLKAPDGVELKATYTPAKDPGPGVLLLHMCNHVTAGDRSKSGKALRTPTRKKPDETLDVTNEFLNMIRTAVLLRLIFLSHP